MPPHCWMTLPTASCTAAKSVRSAATPTDRTPVPGELRGERLGAVGVEVEHGDIRALGRERAADHRAERAGAAGHDRAPALQPHRCLLDRLAAGSAPRPSFHSD